ncbi:MAG: glycosyltransferase, partial [Ilumatobacteraceae bacterium]
MTLPSFAHILSMSDRFGLFEHADHAQPRPEHGYCTDDVARLLIMIVRERDDGQALHELELTAFKFLTLSQSTTGRTRNRRSTDGRWHGGFGVEDCWGRSVWAFGTSAARAFDPGMRSSALSYFGHAVNCRSPHRRA